MLIHGKALLRMETLLLWLSDRTADLSEWLAERARRVGRRAREILKI
jgi:hypothetical protein